MTRLAALAVVVGACGTAPVTPHEPTPEHKPVVADAAVAAPRALWSPLVARRAIDAPHAGEIRTAALTADGKAAISVDELGGVRLWRALDGSVEPRVVELRAPKDVEIANHGTGYFIGALDEVGNLVMLELDAEGRAIARAAVSGDPAFVGLR